MNDLSLEDFDRFYARAHRRSGPFPWQQRLLRTVVETGWPSLLDLPTGTGKTSALDVALFAMALEAHKPKEALRCPRRVVLVVDRRVIVSQARAHAAEIAASLATDTDPVMVAVRERLTRLAPGAPDCVHVAELRGGVAKDDQWAKRPDVPVLAAATVDQVGSRLLFRAYGIGDLSAPIHAGLLGNDTLLLLDEVHLAEPFRQTLSALSRHYRNDGPGGALPDRWAVVQMSATPGERPADAFGLDEEDRGNATLAKRLGASKPARLELLTVKGEGGQATAAFAAGIAPIVKRMLAGGRRRIGVVVNRVDAARAVAQALSGQCDAMVDLVTGRMRPADRDRWLADRKDLLTHRGTADGPALVVVATQCIEAGADFDFDALVTECASLDALRQRFGRLNRQGERGETAACVVMRSDRVKVDDDPVYGAAMKATWDWLLTLGTPDFGIDALHRALDGVATRPLRVQPPNAPVLLPTHLDLWTQTSQHPFPEPELSAWLHGPHRGEPEVSLSWRADLLDENGEPHDPDDLVDLLAAVPLASSEAISLPVSAVRRWTASIADVDGARAQSEAPTERTGVRLLRIVRRRRRGQSGAEWVDAEEVQANDVLVAPAQAGGLRPDGNWDPTSTDAVPDIGDESQLAVRGRRVVRLNPQVHPEIAAPPLPSADGDDGDRVREWLEAQDRGGATSWFRAYDGWRVIPVLGTLVLRATSRERTGEPEISTGEGDTASFTGTRVTLARHLRDVEHWARQLAANVGFSPTLVSDLALAGRLHDLGKADPRFQAMLAGGSFLRASSGELLAKSASDGSDRAARRRARDRAGYPRGCRHELLSVAMVADNDRLRATATDWELILHLVGSHHGWCRPFPPPIADESPAVAAAVDAVGGDLSRPVRHDLASIGSGVADRFWTLQRKYGRWGLAWLEATLRLADHRASEWEENHPESEEAP